MGPTITLSQNRSQKELNNHPIPHYAANPPLTDSEFDMNTSSS